MLVCKGTISQKGRIDWIMTQVKIEASEYRIDY